MLQILSLLSKAEDDVGIDLRMWMEGVQRHGKRIDLLVFPSPHKALRLDMDGFCFAPM
jgi:hypothetical protein